MGEMADFEIDRLCNEMDNFHRYKNSSLTTQYENGLIDEYGITYGDPHSTPFTCSKQAQFMSCIVDSNNDWEGVI